MRGALLAGILLLMLVPSASADPLFAGVQFCAVDVGSPVIRACVMSWDEPQITCLELAAGVRVIEQCFDDPDFPPEIPPSPPSLPTPLVSTPFVSTPNVLCVPESSGSVVRVCLYTYGGPDEGCLEVRALGAFRGTCWTLPLPSLP